MTVYDLSMRDVLQAARAVRVGRGTGFGLPNFSDRTNHARRELDLARKKWMAVMKIDSWAVVQGLVIVRYGRANARRP